MTGPASKEWLQGVIGTFYYKQVPGTENLNQYVKRFLAEAIFGKRLCFSGKTRKNYSTGSILNIKDFSRSFDLYQKEGKRILNFDDITIDFNNDWLTYFYERNCGSNYTGKHLKTLKNIMRQARDDGLHNNNEIERKAFRAISEYVDSIYLNEEEITKL